MWNNNYDKLLVEWAALRESIKTLPLPEALFTVQNYWDRAPICNPYFHVTEPEIWPSPWELLADNCFSELAKCLGICYTIILAEHAEVSSLHIVETDNYCIVQVNNGQYILNDQPGELTQGNTNLTVRYIFDCKQLKL